MTITLARMICGRSRGPYENSSERRLVWFGCGASLAQNGKSRAASAQLPKTELRPSRVGAPPVQRRLPTQNLVLTAVSYRYLTSGACNGSAATRTGTSQGTKEHIRLTRAEYRRIRRQPRGGDRTSASYHSSSNPCPPPEAARRPARARRRRPGLARAGGRAATCLLSQGGTSETRTRASSRKPARAPRRPRAASPPQGWREGRGRGARCPRARGGEAGGAIGRAQGRARVV